MGEIPILNRALKTDPTEKLTERVSRCTALGRQRGKGGTALQVRAGGETGSCSEMLREAKAPGHVCKALGKAFLRRWRRHTSRSQVNTNVITNSHTVVQGKI